MSSRIVILSVLLLCAVPASAVSARFEPAVKARIDGGNVVVLFADGTRSIVPLALNPRSFTAPRRPFSSGKWMTNSQSAG